MVVSQNKYYRWWLPLFLYQTMNPAYPATTDQFYFWTWISKSFANSLAFRLLNILPSLIHPDKVGFIKGCQAPDTTGRILNLIRHTDIHKILPLFWPLVLKKHLIKYTGGSSRWSCRNEFFQTRSFQLYCHFYSGLHESVHIWSTFFWTIDNKGD